ncbi:hypothetical protein ACF3DV_26035 [Chlorogloeopsis fritschii PCC 9212]|uniref:DUF8173 domain-containing protein n=1 Tax=Chlorogloeopsis fritschii PCC 6912 TaxID=211165 RepID=A0A3S0XRU8_CHLFR|nr:hypothetical protein [Chlorogloeopsis fritschii]RUR79154.1 hypothetical protein PCC6912_33280 [Chlorogloeopsis fritschii PCC 6912]
MAFGGDVVLRERARVEGDAVAFGGAVIQAQGARIGGDIVTGFRGSRRGVDFLRRWGIVGILFASIIFYLFLMLAIAVVGILLMLLLPNVLQSIAAIINQYPLKSGLWGLGSIAALILLTVLLVGSLFGNLLIPLVNLIVMVAGLLSAISMSLLIGKKILTAPSRLPMQQFLVGILILGLIGLIPIVGGLFFFAVAIFGFGAILLWLLGKVQPPIVGQTHDQVGN